MIVDDAALAKAEQIRQNYANAQAQISGDRRLTYNAQYAALARATLAARAAMAALRDQTETAADAQRKGLVSKLFGVQGLGDSVAAAMSLRDAQDRVRSVDRPQDALAMLQQAVDAGDSIMIRAIGQYAFQQASLLDGTEWVSVVNEWLEERTDDAAPLLDQLTALNAPQTDTISQLMAFWLPEPVSTSGRQEYELQEIADNPSMQPAMQDPNPASAVRAYGTLP